MQLYRFRTFRTSYFFPRYSARNKVLYNLYTPYGNKVAKIVWWTFKNIPPFRWLFICLKPDLEFPYSDIVAMCPENSILSFNLGTPGVEQKISILGIEKDGQHFFAKYSIKARALDLSKNEIKVLTALKDTGITPYLLDYNITDEYVFFRTSCIKGKNPIDTSLNSEVWKLLDVLSHHHLPTTKKFEGLKTCLSHGDFTPWNMMMTEGEYRLIDWEMAEELPVGYDILTYITQLPLLLEPDKPLYAVIEENQDSLLRYFSAMEIDDWQPYISAFATRKYQNKIANGQLAEAERYKELIP